MALEIKLNQKLSQTLVMTPQLQQAIKLLQLGRVEYMEVIDRELLENPLLEDLRDQPEDPEGRESSQDRTPPKSENEWVNYYELYAESYSSGYGKARKGDPDEDRAFEATVTKQEGLFSHLLWQVRTLEIPAPEKEIAIQIIGNLNRDGYLVSPVTEIAADARCSMEEVEKVLALVQNLDPPGIAARDLRECLLIQLEQMGRRDSLSAKIVSDHLPKLEMRRYDQVAKEEGVKLETVFEALKEIQKLEPRPGRPFVDEAPVYITPDIYVRKLNDEWVVTLNENGMPKLRLNPEYRELLNNGGTSSEKEYLQERVRSATWLMKSIHQRQQTIYKVAESIMKFQRDFLELGVQALRPLVLREVAEDVKMHESTVSRVTTNKYIHTPHGVFELKFFFSSGLNSEGGSVSSESVKEKIRQLVSEEDPVHPLSDQAIVKQLKAEGIEIARRTVAKYREMMNLLSSSRRKKVF